MMATRQCEGDEAGRPVPAQRLGAVRHARQRLGVVPGLVRELYIQKILKTRKVLMEKTTPACCAAALGTTIASSCRAAVRHRCAPSYRSNSVGCRVVLCLD